MGFDVPVPCGSSMGFEPASTGDVRTLRTTARESEAYWGYDTVFLDEFDSTFNITGEFISSFPVFVSREKGEIIAFWGAVPDGVQCELEYFYISRSVLKHGYGKCLWNHFTGWCRDNGIREITFVTSWEAVGFYLKMGAVQDGTSRSVIDGREIPHFVYTLKYN